MTARIPAEAAGFEATAARRDSICTDGSKMVFGMVVFLSLGDWGHSRHYAARVGDSGTGGSVRSARNRSGTERQKGPYRGLRYGPFESMISLRLDALHCHD